jgi:hypothetical protein
MAEEKTDGEYRLSETYGDIGVNFERADGDYSFTIQFKGEILFEYNSSTNETGDYVLRIVEGYSFSRRYYYFRSLFESISAAKDQILQQEDHINSLTGNDWPFYFAAVWHYFGYMLRTLNDNTKLMTGDDSSQSHSPLEDNIRNLSFLYPAFRTDYAALVKHNFIVPQDDGSLRLGKRNNKDVTKKFLADYFSSVKPEEYKEMSWTSIEKIFNVKNMAQTLSTNGNPNKNKEKKSVDFEEWQKIKERVVRHKI